MVKPVRGPEDDAGVYAGSTLTLALMAGAAIAVAVIVACRAEPPPETRDARLQRVAHEIVGRQLSEPEAAQYLGVHVVDRNGITTVCGSVNARLDGGRYTGPRRFMVAGDAAVIEGDLDFPAFTILWTDLCGARGE